MIPIFDTNREYPMMHVWLLQSSIYGWTDGRTDGRRQRQYPFGLKDQGVKIIDSKSLM